MKYYMLFFTLFLISIVIICLEISVLTPFVRGWCYLDLVLLGTALAWSIEDIMVDK